MSQRACGEGKKTTASEPNKEILNRKTVVKAENLKGYLNVFHSLLLP